MTQPRLLIVDDIADNRAILSRRFERRGFDIVEAAGGLAALELIGRERFDVVLLDVVMPDLDGLQVLERIRQTWTQAQLPVVMVTAKSEDTDVVKALELGANDYLTKPVNFSVAFARVQAQIARKQAEEELRQAHANLQGHVRQLEEAVAERHKSEAKVAHMARHDELTALGNRVLLQDQLAKAVKRVEAHGARFALLCLDVNQFKAINDSCGHARGDQLLQALACRLQGCVSDRDTVVRLGSDEFAVIATEAATPEAANALAHCIMKAVAQPCLLGGLQLAVTCSVGIALAPADGTDPGVLLRNAELALVGAKREGRNRAQFFEPAMNARAQARHVLELDLHKALTAGEFEILYQPLFDLRSERVTGFEALLRWNHPERGVISPADFIPVAEESDDILRIGEWVLRRACEEAARWPGDTKVAVNLSAVQFRQPTLPDIVVSALAGSGLAAHRLELELTETALLKNTEQTSALLHRIRGLGVRISMDDFGTGYSSLSYLRSFPFDKIKIDGSFIRDLSEAPESRAIIRAVTSLAQSLGMSTTAECVETQAQFDILRAEGCTEVQGFLIGKPMGSCEVPRFLGRFGALETRIAV